MTTKEIEERIGEATRFVPVFENNVTNRIENINNNIDDLVINFKNDIDNNINTQNSILVQGVSVLILNAEYHLVRAYYHASPGLIAIFTAIVKAIGVVVKIVKTILSSKIFQTIYSLHKIAVALIPGYKREVYKLFKSVSDFSKQIGLGVDGLQHLINVYNKGSGVIAGMMGWDTENFQGERLERTSVALKKISGSVHGLANNPAEYIDKLGELGDWEDWQVSKKKWDDIYTWINETSNKTEQTVNEVSKILNEVNLFAASLPDFIRENIPQFIYDTLETLDTAINEKVLPTLNIIQRKMVETNNIIDTYSKKLTVLNNKMTLPGSVLLGVDDLPDYAKDTQLKMIDDVVSRQYQKDVDKDNVVRNEKMAALESIREALTAPTEYPEFLGLEFPRPPEISGIVAEPGETWFVGDY